MCSQCFDKFAWIYNLIRGATKKEYNLLKKCLEMSKDQRALDIGGGTGLVAKQLANDVKEVVVLDPSQKMLDRINDKRIKKKVGIAQNLPFKKEEFDIICLVDSLHHFTNGFPKEEWDHQIDICLKEILRVLKKDGQLVIVEYNTHTFVGGFVKFFENTIMRWGSNFYDSDKLAELFPSKYHAQIVDPTKFTYALKITKK